jgi:hypothetical protein
MAPPRSAGVRCGLLESLCPVRPPSGRLQWIGEPPRVPPEAVESADEGSEERARAGREVTRYEAFLEVES